MILQKNVPLLVIDVQKAFADSTWGNRNNAQAEENIEHLIRVWRETERPIIYVKHISTVESSLFYKGKASSEFMDFIYPAYNELVITKQVNSAFIGTNLEVILREMECPNIVVTGLTTNHCVETTTRMAGNLGFNPYVVSDATATFDRKGIDGQLYSADLIQMISLANLYKEFAEVVDTKTIISIARIGK